jgi:hypothetical protein
MNAEPKICTILSDIYFGVLKALFQSVKRQKEMQSNKTVMRYTWATICVDAG